MIAKNLWRLLKFQILVVAGFVFIILGAALISASLPKKTAAAVSALNEAVGQQAASRESGGATTELEISGTPVKIEIPSLGISLKVIPGYYYPATKSWTLSLNNAQYAAVSAPANNKKGMTFIYAHNRPGVFMSLPKITPGDQARIIADNGHTFTYTYRSSMVVKPDDTSIFSYSGRPILVTQTCTGLWYQDRQLFIFDLTETA